MTELLTEILADLQAESDRLEGLVIEASDWSVLTPAEGWTIGHQLGHLAWTDEVAVLAAAAAARVGEPPGPGKAAWDEVVLAALSNPDGFVDESAAQAAAAGREELLSRWTTARAALQQSLTELPAGYKLPWFGPPMSALSMATARFMETWAHSLDVAEALGVTPQPRDSVRHVVELGVRTRAFSFATHSLTPSAAEMRVELTAPSGAVWAYGPADAEQTVHGSAYDFALLVTQRRNRADLDVHAVGVDADQWLSIAQAFAGPPGGGREAAPA